MEEIKKVLEVFGDYLEEDTAVEIIQTSHGITVGVWSENNSDWEDFINCATAKELCKELCRQYCAFYEAASGEEKEGDLTEEGGLFWLAVRPSAWPAASLRLRSRCCKASRRRTSL